MDMISCLICPFFKKYFFQKCPQNLGNFKKRLILFCISSGIFIGLFNGTVMLTENRPFPDYEAKLGQGLLEPGQTTGSKNFKTPLF